MIRKIVSIDENKCDGCGLCAEACHEHAIQIVDGKAKLIHDKYCDGLGDCLPACPMDAIKLIERDAADYDEEAVKEIQRIKALESKEKKPVKETLPCGCPGTLSRSIIKPSGQIAVNKATEPTSQEGTRPSELRQWPVQLRLLNPRADYLNGANLLVAADCTAYAYGDFHKDFIKDHILVIGCPKLDDNEGYQEKLADMLRSNDIKSITVVRMEVPCCGGIVRSVKGAMLKSEKIVPYREVTIGIDGTIRN